MYKLLTLVFLLCLMNGLPADVSAQSRIAGKVIDSLDKGELQGASVQLLNSRDSVLLGNSAGPNGTFTFTPPRAGSYKIRVNFLGYITRTVNVRVRTNQAPAPLTVLLSPDATALEVVEVVAPPKVVELRGDTTSFNAAAFSTEAYADADALIGQLPGVEIDEEGNVKAQGENVQRIIVDGKEFFSTDPRVALKSLPADIIDRIEIIDEQSEQAQFSGFDDGERRKIINIVTKPDRRNGYFGRVAGAFGSRERYNGGGNISMFSGDRRITLNAVSNNVNQQGFGMADIGANDDEGNGGNGGGQRGGTGMGRPGNASTNSASVNYNNEWTDKVELNANYSFSTRDNTINSLQDRETLIGGGNNQYRIQQSLNNTVNTSHRAGVRLEYEPDSTQSLDFDPNFSYQQFNRISNSNSNTSLATEEPVNRSDGNNDSRDRNFSLSGDLDYRLRLGKPGRTISLRANGSINSNKGLAQSYTLNEYYEDYLIGQVDTTNVQNNSVGNGNGITGRLAYTEPLGEKGRVQANYSIRNTANYSNREALNFLAETGQFSELDERLSNEFRNDYVYQSGGLSYQWTNQQLRFDFGVDYQNANLTNHKLFPDDVRSNRSFSSYLPNASLRYRFSREQDLRLDYQTATNAPSIDQLQDFVNRQNPLYIRTGNPDLEQAFQHTFRLRYNKVNRTTGANIGLNANAEFVNNSIVNSTLIATDSTLIVPTGDTLQRGGQFSRPVNVNGFFTMRGNFIYGTPISLLKLNLNLNTGIFRDREVGLQNEPGTLNLVEAQTNSWGINQRIAVNSRIGPKLIYSLSYTGNYSISKSTTNINANYTSYNQTLRNDLTWIFWKGIRINSSIMYNTYDYNSGAPDADDNRSFILWNASIGKKLFSKEEGEISLSAYDLLNKNTNITRWVSQTAITNSQSNMLRQYFMLTFTYNLRSFGGSNGGSGMRENRGGGYRGGGMGGGLRNR